MDISKLFRRGTDEFPPDDRTEESIKANLLAALSINPCISGRHDGQVGFMHFSQAVIQNPEFAKAIDSVVNFVLLLYPIPKKSAAVDEDTSEFELN